MSTDKINKYTVLTMAVPKISKNDKSFTRACVILTKDLLTYLQDSKEYKIFYGLTLRNAKILASSFDTSYYTFY